MYFRRSAAEAKRRRQAKASGIRKSSSHTGRDRNVVASLLHAYTRPNPNTKYRRKTLLHFFPFAITWKRVCVPHAPYSIHSALASLPPETIRKSRCIIKIQNGVSASTTNNYKPCLFTLFYSDYKSFGWNKSGNP